MTTQGASARPLSIDEILKGSGPMPPPAPDLSRMRGKSKAVGELIHTADDMRRLKARTERETAERDAAFYVQALLTNISTLFQGDQMAVGQAIDDAITYYFAALQSAQGEDVAARCACTVIHNTAQFLPEKLKAAVIEALG